MIKNEMKLINISGLMLKLRTFLFVLVLALFMSHYTERLFTPFLIGVKNIITTGSFSKNVEIDGGYYTLYDFIDKPVVNPVNVAQRAFYNAENCLIQRKYKDFSLYAYDSTKFCDKELILETVNWITEKYSVERLGHIDVLRFSYDFDFDKLGLKKPWFSGMAQSLMVINFLAAYELTSDVRFLDRARLAANLLFIEMKDGGVVIRQEDGGVWFEEYASSALEEYNSAAVLNGNNFSIDALFWMSNYDPSALYSKKFQEAVTSLDNNISRYASMSWSYYDLNKEMASFLYHDIHIKQLNKIHKFYCNVINCNGATANLISYKNRFFLFRLIPFGFFERLIYQTNNMLFGILFVNILWLYFFNFIIRRIWR